MKGRFDNITICGIASYVPTNVVDNTEPMRAVDDKRAKKQVRLTGIKKRRIAVNGQRGSDLATMAAEKLLNKLQWDRNEIDVLIYVTQNPDLKRPSTAMLIQKRLGIGMDCSAFDINMGCSGYVVGLQTIAAILSNTGGKGLLLAAEAIYRDYEYETLDADAMLYGEAGTATAVEIAPNTSMLYSQKSDGNRYHTICVNLRGRGNMDGTDVLLFAMNEVAREVNEFMNTNNLSVDDIDYYVFHQAQKMILMGISTETGIGFDRFLNSYEDYGNTSSASIPISICANKDKIASGRKARFLLCGFGIGLSWGVVKIDIDPACIEPIEESDYHYPDREEIENGF